MTDGRTRAEPQQTPEGAEAAVRPTIIALLESIALPAIYMLADGRVAAQNHSAAILLTPGADRVARVHAHDGTDLWTIVSARADEAHPFFDVRARVRVADGQVSELTLMVVPVRGSADTLAGAIVLALDALGTRIRGFGDMDASSGGRLEGVVRRLGEITGATDTYVIESEPGFGAEASVVASWSREEGGVPIGAFDVRGTPSDSFAGRRFVCVPDGLADVYPDDSFFRTRGCAAYAGVLLRDSAGEQVGILAGLWREPIADVAGISAVFTITSVVAARLLVDRIAQRELRESEQRYSAVFEGSAVPIMLIDPETTQIIDANPAACEFYGFPRDELMSMSVLQTDALSADTVRAELERAAAGTRVHFASKHLLSGGRVRDVEVNIGPIRVGGRALLYSMIHDITERKRMESELERAKRNLEIIVGQRTEDLLRTNAELQQASVARDMVFASLAREMRTSLQTISGFSELLLGGMAGELSDEQRRQVEMIKEAGRQLAGFGTRLLESRKEDDPGDGFEIEAFDIVDLVESVLFGLGSFADEKGLGLDVVAEERPFKIETDRFMCQQILLNLLSNAIRYTEHGGVTVTVSRVGDEHCAVAVADTGPGLSRERLETLFQGPEVHAPAAGIGLPASQRIAAVLHGTIDATSSPGEGSVFRLVLPLAITEPAHAGKDDRDADKEHASGS